MILFHPKSFLSLGCMKARELARSKQAPFSLSQRFLGSIGDVADVTSWNPTGSAVRLHLTKARFLQKGLKKVDMV